MNDRRVAGAGLVAEAGAPMGAGILAARCISATGNRHQPTAQLPALARG